MSRQESPRPQRDVGTAQRETRADRKKEREGENAEKQGEGRESGGRRKEEGGTERQRVLGETAKEPLHEKAERSSKKALRAGVLSSTLSSAAARVGRRPDDRRGRGPPLPRSTRRARRNPRRKRRGRLRARAAVAWAAGPGGEAAARSVRLTHSRPARSSWACARRPAAHHRHEGSARELSTQTCRPSTRGRRRPRTGRLRAQRRCRVLASACATVDRAQPGRTRNGGRRP